MTSPTRSASSIPTDRDFVTNFNEALRIGLGTAGMLLLEHVVLWNQPYRLPRPVAYLVGTATLGCGFSAWAWRRYPDAVIGYWMIAGICGSAVVGAYWIRHVLHELDRRAYVAGRIAGTAKGWHRGYNETSATGD
jgi:hypothetical protein